MMKHEIWWNLNLCCKVIITQKLLQNKLCLIAINVKVAFFCINNPLNLIFISVPTEIHITQRNAQNIMVKYLSIRVVCC